jgi:hypothetical protein
MVLIKSNPEKYHILAEGDKKRMLQLLEDVTILNENNNEFKINEEFIDGDVIIYDFACKEKGYLYSLVVCHGVAYHVSELKTS